MEGLGRCAVPMAYVNVYPGLPGVPVDCKSHETKAVDQPIRTLRTFVHHYNSTQ